MRIEIGHMVCHIDDPERTPGVVCDIRRWRGSSRDQYWIKWAGEVKLDGFPDIRCLDGYYSSNWIRRIVLE